MERGDVPYTAEELIQLPAEPASAARARAFVRDRLHRGRHRALEAPALLCVTELVANVSVHTDSCECVVAVRDTTDSVLIEVSDQTSELPTMRPVSLQAEHGRGLQIVDALAREWGVRHSPGRCKSVWVRLVAGGWGAPGGSSTGARPPAAPVLEEGFVF